ncbi:MAG: hypothetical protein KDA22_00770 [Phycisphaerales bacterium]|nr:hypothetical protein [Phycisphaerales bacterium]
MADDDPHDPTGSTDGPPPSDAAADAGPRVSGLRMPCGGCGAMLAYLPGSTMLHCAHCGRETPIEEVAPAGAERDLQATLARLADAQTTVEVQTVSCASCGASVTISTNVAAQACPFCGTHLNVVMQTTRLIKPGSILPFGIARDAAEAAFRKWIAGLWFAPNSLKREAWESQHLRGIYLPYWTYDAATASQYTGQRGDDYTVTVGSGKNRRTERRTRWRSVSGRVSRRFDDVLIAATGSLPRKHLDALTPWDLEHLVGYDDRFVAGFAAEAYQTEVDKAFAEAQAHMRNVIEVDVRHDIGGDHQRILSLDTDWWDLTFKHVLLPVWVSAYRYRGRNFLFLVNARTGEVRGDRPWSWIKILLAVAGGLAAAAAIVAGVVAVKG